MSHWTDEKPKESGWYWYRSDDVTEQVRFIELSSLSYGRNAQWSNEPVPLPYDALPPTEGDLHR